MNEPAIQTPIATTDPATVKPKVLRRPAQFARPSMTAAEILPMPEVRLDYIPIGTPITPPTPATRPWQEDARFGVALLAVVIAINLMVALALAGSKPTSSTPPARIVQDHRESPFVSVPDEATVPVDE